MAGQTWQEWFENAWAVRDENIYRSLFGDVGSGIYPLLRRMVAFQILLSVEKFEGKELLQAWDRIPLRAPIDGMSSKLNWVLLTPAPNFSKRQFLPSGHFDFLEFVGITEDEADFARKEGGIGC